MLSQQSSRCQGDQELRIITNERRKSTCSCFELISAQLISALWFTTELFVERPDCDPNFPDGSAWRDDEFDLLVAA